MIRRAFIVAAVVGTAGLAIFFWLGGFNEIKYQRIENVSNVVIGKEYIGKSGSNELEKLFLSSRTLAEEERLDGVLVIISYEAQDQPKEILHYFVGIMLEEVPGNIVEDYEIMELEPSNYISARIESHSIVMPTSEKVRNDAIKNLGEGESLGFFSIEKYLDEGIMEIDFPIVQN